MPNFRTELMAVPGGGQYVCVPDKVAAQAELEHAARVRGEEPETRARRLEQVRAALTE
jgi:hypothetical protein